VSYEAFAFPHRVLFTDYAVFLFGILEAISAYQVGTLSRALQRLAEDEPVANDTVKVFTD
jgi:hypothetical protein